MPLAWDAMWLKDFNSWNSISCMGKCLFFFGCVRWGNAPVLLCDQCFSFIHLRLSSLLLFGIVGTTLFHGNMGQKCLHLVFVIFVETKDYGSSVTWTLILSMLIYCLEANCNEMNNASFQISVSKFRMQRNPFCKLSS